MQQPVQADSIVWRLIRFSGLYNLPGKRYTRGISMMRQATVGVIGHVDHGKTSLVRALTGMETDRLEEERRRGMSIVPGYAWLEYPTGSVDLIDVPGHEDFIRMMIAGASGMDAVLLVVDGREGIKPQTREHFAVAQLLGVSRGLLAVTKSDLLSEPQRSDMRERVRGLIRNSFLGSAPVIFTSAVTAEGIDELATGLRELLREANTERAAGAYLPVDRVFSVRGHGAVVTGTLHAGSLGSGQSVRLLPSGAESAVRRIEVHGREVREAWPGQRVGVNLRGVSHHAISRGELLSTLDAAMSGHEFLVEVCALDEKEARIAGTVTVKILAGTAEATARVRLLDGEHLGPGQAGYAQLCLDRAIAVVRRQPFVLRSLSPVRTIGGGRILEAAAGRARRNQPLLLGRLRVIAYGDLDERVAERVEAAGCAGTSMEAVARDLGVSRASVAAAVTAGRFLQHGQALMSKPAFESLRNTLASCLSEFHARYPLRPGLPLASLHSRLPRQLGDDSFALLVHHCVCERTIALEQSVARLAGHDPMRALGAEEREELSTLEQAFREGGVTPPDAAAVIRGLRRREELLRLLIERGVLIRLPCARDAAPIVFHADAVRQAKDRLRRAFPSPARFTVSEAKCELGTTRKFAVPLMEYLDGVRFTRRIGDHRSIARE